MFHCGGTSDSITGGGDDGGGADGTGAEASSGGEGGGGHEGGGGPDGGHDATSSSGGDSGGGPEAGSSGGGEAGGGEAGKNEGGSGDGGHPEAGGGDGGGTDAGSGEAGGGEAGAGDGGSGDAGGGDTGAAEGGGGDAGAGDAASEAGAGDGGGAEGGATEAGAEGGTTEAGVDGGAGDAGDGGVVAQAFFRAGALMPAPAAIDFCWQQGGGAWNGPVMAGWSIQPGLQYQQVTEYVPVPVASTTVRFVGASANDCNTGIAEVSLSPQAANDRFFVALFQQGTAAEQAKAFVDESPVLAGTGTRMRAIHAALTAVGIGGTSSAPVDFYVAGSITAPSLFDDVPFGGTAAANNAVDANGYLSHDAFAGVDMRVRLHATLADLVREAGFTTSGGHAYSLFTTGVHLLSGTNKTPMMLLLCDDSAPAVGHLGVCAAGGTQL